MMTSNTTLIIVSTFCSKVSLLSNSTSSQSLANFSASVSASPEEAFLTTSSFSKEETLPCKEIFSSVDLFKDSSSSATWSAKSSIKSSYLLEPRYNVL